MLIRTIEPKDFQSIVDLNSAEVLNTSPMNIEHLRTLISYASFSRLAVLNKEVVGFALAIRNGKNYINVNYDWFSSNFINFIYVDRVVVSEICKGQGVGSRIYEKLFSYARKENIEYVLCEYNIEPMNAVSQAFHNHWGFKEVGTQRISKSNKLVSLQAAKT